MSGDIFPQTAISDEQSFEMKCYKMLTGEGSIRLRPQCSTLYTVLVTGYTAGRVIRIPYSDTI